MSGFEVLRSLRVSKVKTPILILLGLAAIEDKVSGLGYGADDYMTKPFHKDELICRHVIFSFSGPISPELRQREAPLGCAKTRSAENVLRLPHRRAPDFRCGARIVP
jgi:CheY-like chemotaxis protein